MTLKEELEILRGEPIDVFDGDPTEIPCIETSDAEKLCKHPVVSVCMVTYNHEPYIRQAIEGVMMQKADFEFELVIGEDCSQDRTREICFEYQKKYPDKIRVLWWHDNVSKGGLGGNGLRVRARCRGEYIAFCEGDDYWIDPLKLQKQVDLMRRHGTVALAFTSGRIFNNQTDAFRTWDGEPYYSDGRIDGEEFFKIYSFGKYPVSGCGPECFIMTASCLIRTELYKTLIDHYELFKWRLRLGDKQLWLGLAMLGDVYYLPDKTVVYRENSGGAMNRYGALIYRDSALAKIYLSISGPYRCVVPIPILLTLFLNQGSSSLLCTNSATMQLEALESLLKRGCFSASIAPWRVRVKWLLFRVIKRKWVFKIGRGLFSVR